MLSGSEPGAFDLVQTKRELTEHIPQDLVPFVTESNRVMELMYPVRSYPEKITSLNFDKDPNVMGVLNGIKGQYLMLDNNRVINIRKFGGYLVKMITST